jgi:hypothetical protein
MKATTVIGIIAIILGLALLGGSYYIQKKVNEGKVQIADAQSKVDTGSALFSQIPIAKDVVKDVGKVITTPVQNKIDEGRKEVAQYEQMAYYMKIGGIIAVLVGAILLVVRRKKA